MRRERRSALVCLMFAMVAGTSGCSGDSPASESTAPMSEESRATALSSLTKAGVDSLLAVADTIYGSGDLEGASEVFAVALDHAKEMGYVEPELKLELDPRNLLYDEQASDFGRPVPFASRRKSMVVPRTASANVVNDYSNSGSNLKRGQ